jgi:hypothetical protein
MPHRLPHAVMPGADFLHAASMILRCAVFPQHRFIEEFYKGVGIKKELFLFSLLMLANIMKNFRIRLWTTTLCVSKKIK